MRLKKRFVFQQLTIFEESYPQLQDLIIAIRNFRKEGESEIDAETIKEWETLALQIDKVMRDRIFILIVAAERGWRVATDTAFNMKGNLKVQTQKPNK